MSESHGNAETRKFFWDLTDRVLEACVEVHRHLGPGLLESTYERCLAHELALERLAFKRQHAIAIGYKGLELEDSYRADFLVADVLVVELKVVTELQPVHVAQTLTYMKLLRTPVGLLVNFNVEAVRGSAIKRLVLTQDTSVFPRFRGSS